MWIKLKNFFVLKGTWAWAVKQLEKGKIVYRATDTGAAKYRLDSENQGRIVWCFSRKPNWEPEESWSSAYIFISDFTNTSWRSYP